MNNAHEVRLDGGPLSIADVNAAACGGASVTLGDKATRAIAASRELLEGIAGDGEPHYGINTGFGAFARVRVSDTQLAELQRNLIRSHAAGVGKPMPRETVRGMMLCLAASLSRGCSGVRPVVIEIILALLNAAPFVKTGSSDESDRSYLPGVTPIVPEVGSCGASGDLAPLAHVVLVMMGEGEAEYAGRVMPAAEALDMAGIEPIGGGGANGLQAKEGLALINGTHLMAAQAALACAELDRLLEAAFIATAMSIDACRATDTFLDERIHAVRNQAGQQRAAAKLRELLRGSAIVTSHVENDPRVQDPYSLRCSPQVLGAVLDTYEHVRRVVEAELGAVTDNPLVFNITQKTKGKNAHAGAPPTPVPRLNQNVEGVALSGGNFHGMPMALALDTLAVAIAHIAGISERRTYHMLSGFDPETRLPHFLAPRPGLHSGYMIAQYASAACVNEIATQCFPASVVNLTTSAGMEDYNSWGPRSAAKCRRILELARSVVSIELLCAAQALEHHRPLKSSAAVEAVHATIRGVVAKLDDDRPPAPDIKAIERLIEEGAFGSH